MKTSPSQMLLSDPAASLPANIVGVSASIDIETVFQHQLFQMWVQERVRVKEKKGEGFRNQPQSANM